MADSAELAANLDRIARRAQGAMRPWAWRQAAERGAEVLAPTATAVPLLVLAASVWGLFSGRSWWSLGVAPTIALAIALPLASMLVATVLAYLRHPPSRAMRLAFHDHRLGLRDRLQAADFFLRAEAPSGFAQAAIEDAAGFAQRALAAELPKLQWRWPALRPGPWPLGVLALVALVIGLLLRGQSLALGDSAEDAGAGEVDNPVAAAPAAEQPDEEPAHRENQRSPPPRPAPRPSELFAFAADAGGERPPLGMGALPADFEPSETRAANAQASQAGLAAAGASSQSADQAPRPKRERTRKPAGKRRKPTEMRREESASSGVAGGSGTSAGSRLAASDHPAADNKARSDESQDDVEDDAEDEEDEEQKAAATRKPMLNNQKAPVDRSLTPAGIGDQERDDLNGRSGPGGLKKTRGVAAMLLGVPMPDHLRGKPNPGRVKVRRERSAPEEKAVQAVPAAARGRRDEAFGDINHMRLPPRARSTVRDYFLAQRQTTNNAKEEP